MSGANIRIGIGIDIHPFAAERALFLGGVRIEFARGLAGHSDADVLLHAITDALLGALGWGDIGEWFPPTDERFRGADSRELFLNVWQKAAEAGWKLVNCDSVVLAEEPRLGPHKEAIKKSIAGLFGSLPECVSVKAKTSERLGFVGREEGIAAHAVVLIKQ